MAGMYIDDRVKLCSPFQNVQVVQARSSKLSETTIIAPEKCYPRWLDPTPRSSWLNTGAAAQSPPMTPLALLAVSNSTCQQCHGMGRDGQHHR